MTDDPIIRMPDIRAVHMCSRGSRQFFERHGLDWQDFLKNGIPASKLAATGDHMALTLVEHVRGKQ